MALENSENKSAHEKSVRDDSTRFTMVAKTLAGLEDLLAEELAQLGAREIEIGKRMVRFEGDQKLLYTANYRLRTALRILKPIYEFSCNNIEELYGELVQFNWTRFLKVDQTFLIDPVVYSDNFSNSRYVSYRVKDALADFFTKHHPEGRRPSVSTKNPDIRFNIHIAARRVTLSIDSSGESLHKRGYKVKQTPAPMNEVLAAGILLKAGWDGSCNLIDPMCGSGTFLIEGAMIARNIAAGTWREHFSFQEWKDFDATLWQSVKEDTSYEKDFQHHIYGSDVANDAFTVTEANITNTGMGRDVSVERINFADLEPAEEKAILIMNPPYGERLNRYDLEDLYGMIGTQLKHKYTGCTAWIIAPKRDFSKAIALRPSSKETLYNGDIECELRGFELFDGKRDDFKRDQKEGKSRSFHKANRGGRREDSQRNERRDRNTSSSYRRKDERRENFSEGGQRDFSKVSKFKDERKSFDGEHRSYSRDRAERRDFRSREEKRERFSPSEEHSSGNEMQAKPARKRARIGSKEQSRNIPRSRFADRDRKRSQPAVQVFDEDND